MADLIIILYSLPENFNGFERFQTDFSPFSAARPSMPAGYPPGNHHSLATPLFFAASATAFATAGATLSSNAAGMM